MSVVGIGVAVRRKEDFRFVTGRGQYTDDINRPGQRYIHFVRSAAVMNAITDAVGTETSQCRRPRRWCGDSKGQCRSQGGGVILHLPLHGRARP
jgi:hypothetical protein